MFKALTDHQSQRPIAVPRTRRVFALVAASALLGLCEARAANKIALIGNLGLREPAGIERSHRVARLGAYMRATPVFAGTEIVIYPLGWPAETAALNDATVVVLGFGAVQSEAPAFAPEQLAQLQRMVDAGVGVVCLFQSKASDVLNTSGQMAQWLGVRPDSSFQTVGGPVSLVPSTPGHPVVVGVDKVACQDEVQTPRSLESRVVPILRAAKNTATANDAAQVAAWLLERPNGGRSFAFTGSPSLATFEEASLIQLLLNAVAWTAKLSATAGGAAPIAPVVGRAVVTKAADCKPLPQSWGELVWYTSAAQGNSRTMTTGLAVILPGKSNPVHFHPNCDEVLHVIRGRITHTMDGESAEMTVGDTVSIPVGTLHNATNIGEEVALLSIAFSSAYRQVIGYK
jgi:quercetin dioxygenase-like cupin family protein